jgi:hypothetical protein
VIGFTSSTCERVDYTYIVQKLRVIKKGVRIVHVTNNVQKTSAVFERKSRLNLIKYAQSVVELEGTKMRSKKS